MIEGQRDIARINQVTHQNGDMNTRTVNLLAPSRVGRVVVSLLQIIKPIRA